MRQENSIEQRSRATLPPRERVSRRSKLVCSVATIALSNMRPADEANQGGLEISIEDEEVSLKALLTMPSEPKGLVIFAHGSGSGRHSPRNQFVSNVLNQSGFVTILADLLMEEESGDRNKVFDIDLLADRLSLITNWVARHPRLGQLSVGYFGASTGAAAAIQAAAENKGRIQAVVSRGGRPDLAMEFLDELEASTLLIVGSLDEQVIELNRFAYEQMDCEKEMDIVQGASHLFEEPGTLEQVAALAARWFETHLLQPRRPMARGQERPSQHI